MYKVYIANAYESIWKSAGSDRCRFECMYKSAYSFLLSGIKKLSVQAGIMSNANWLNRKGFEDDGKYDIIIVFDAETDFQCLREHISNKRADQRYIFYYWNPVKKSNISPNTIKEIGYEVWSFDPGDCKEYDLKYNPSFYFAGWYDGLCETAPKYDVCYFGRDKDGRGRIVEELFKKMKDMGLTTYAYLTAPRWYKRLSAGSGYRRYLDINSMIREECKSRAILEYVCEGQSGVTLRTFDALCNGVKLITNNRYIKNMDIYDKGRVFVLGEDKLTDLPAFLSSDYSVDREIIDRYRFENWLDRFYDR